MKQVPATYSALLQSLLEIRTQEEILDMVCIQLQRDLTRGGHPLDLSSTNSNNWTSVLSSHLNQLSDDRLTSLLYLIDLPETLIRQIAYNPENRHDLASAVLYRELLKVYYKLHYS